MYAKLSFFDPEMGVENGDQARGWVATTFPDAPPALFNRDQEGRNLQGHCPFAICPCDGGVVIYGVGRPAFEVLMRFTMDAQAVFHAQYQRGEFTFASGGAGLQVGAFVREYAVHDLILENTHGRRWLYRDRGTTAETSPELNAQAEEVLRSALDQRCAVLGIEFPAEASIAMVEARPVRPCKAGAGDKLLYAVEVRFTSNLIFDGPWFLGRLASKGCGRIKVAPTGRRAETATGAGVAP